MTHRQTENRRIVPNAYSTAVARQKKDFALGGGGKVPCHRTYTWCIKVGGHIGETTQMSVVFRVSRFQKWANLPLPSNVQKLKVFQLQRGLRPLVPDQGLRPRTLLGAPPDSHYRLALRNRHGLPPRLNTFRDLWSQISSEWIKINGFIDRNFFHILRKNKRTLVHQLQSLVVLFRIT